MKWSVTGLLVLGVVAAVSAAVLMQLMSARPNTVTVLVASRDLAGNTVIEQSCLEEKSVLRSKVPEGTVTDSIEVLGNVLNTRVVAGQPLQKSMFLTKEEADRIKDVPPGYRQVQISPSDLAEGMLYKNCAVDVLLAVNSSQGGKFTRTVLENVHVMGTDSASKGQPCRRVTLLVTSEQALKLSAASSLGSLSLALRSPLDTTRRGEMSLAELTGESQQPSGWTVMLTEMVKAMSKTRPVSASPTTQSGVEPVPVASKPVWTTKVIRNGTVEVVEFPGWTDNTNGVKN